MEEYIRLEEEKALRRGKVNNWETAAYAPLSYEPTVSSLNNDEIDFRISFDESNDEDYTIWDNEDVHDHRSIEIEFSAIVFNDMLTSKAPLSYEPTVSSLNNNAIDFRISFDESDDENYMVVFDKNSFSYKTIFANDLKTDSKNDNDKVDMPFLSPEPTVSYFDDLDFFKDFENEFPAIVYNDARTSKSNLLTKLILSPQHIDEFNLKDETSLT
nr:hypothetical protein [Tanacetum cinerariifolium]